MIKINSAAHRLSTDLIHRSFRPLEIRRVDAVAGFFMHHAFTQPVTNLCLRGSVAKQFPSIPFFCRKQTVSQLTFGGNSETVAVAAKRLSDGVNEADATAAVGEFEVDSGLARIWPRPRYQGAKG